MKLQVLTVAVSRNAGGLFTSVRKLTQAVEKLGVECLVSGFRDEHTAEDISAWDPLTVKTFSPLGPGFFPVSKSMRNAVLEFRPDIIHCHGIWLHPSLIDLTAKRKLGVPYLVSPRGMLDSWALRNSAWKKKLAGTLFENRHLREAACIHALCSSEAESIRAYGLKNPIAVIPNGVELPLLTSGFRPLTSGATRQLLFLGRIHPKKGLKELISAWSLVQSLISNAPSWELLITGWDDGGHEEGLKAQVSSLGLEEQIQFVGPIFGEEKDRLLRRVDAFILPSFSEGLPMAVLEAWAYGLPVLMTDYCNLPEGFKADAALRIAPDPDSIAQGLTQLFSMPPAELIAMGSRGRNLVENQFTWERIASDMKSVYQWCMDRKNPSTCIRFD